MSEENKEGIEELVSRLDKDQIDDREVLAILFRIRKASKGEVRFTIQSLAKRLRNYTSKDLNEMLKELNKPVNSEKDLPYLKIYNEIISRYHIITLKESLQIMIFNNNSYSFDISRIHENISNKCEELNVPINYNEKEVLKKIQSSTLFDEEKLNLDPFLMNFQNGKYHFNKDKSLSCFDPSDEEDFSWHIFHEIPHDYEPINDIGERYRCPTFKNALRKWLSAPFSKIRVMDIFEAIGLCMTVNMGFRTAFLNHGPKRSGKTQFFNVVVHVIGKKNMTFTSLQRLGKNEFGAHGLQFTLLNFCGDLPGTKIHDNGLFKDIVGADVAVPAEIKNGKKYNFFPTNKFWANANKIPLFADWDDDAAYDRFILFNFPNEFSAYLKSTLNDFYKEIISNHDEIQGIIHESIRGYQRLITRGHFRKELKEGTRHLWNYEANIFYKFIYDYCKRDKKERIQVDDFVDIFTDVNPGHQKITITKELTKLGINKKELTDFDLGKKKRFYVGIKWKDHALDKLEAVKSENGTLSVADLMTVNPIDKF